MAHTKRIYNKPNKIRDSIFDFYHPYYQFCCGNCKRCKDLKKKQKRKTEKKKELKFLTIQAMSIFNHTSHV
jgi:hypothetical protein